MLSFLKRIFGAGNSPEIEEKIKSGAYLVDVRSTSEFAGGSVRGAVNIPLNTIQNQIAKFKNKKDIVVFCQSGMRSGQAVSILKKNGIQNVFNGGGWRNVDEIVKKKI